MSAPAFLGEQLSQVPSQVGVEAKIEKAKAEKERGNALFTQGETKQALVAYHSCKMCIKGFLNLPEEQTASIKAIELSCNLNMAAAYVKLGEWQKAVHACTAVLDSDANNIKALFRRGKAYLEIGNCDSARADLAKAIKLSPNDTTLRDEYARLQSKEAQQTAQNKNFFKSVFAGAPSTSAPASSN